MFVRCRPKVSVAASSEAVEIRYLRDLLLPPSNFFVPCDLPIATARTRDQTLASVNVRIIWKASKRAFAGNSILVEVARCTSGASMKGLIVVHPVFNGMQKERKTQSQHLNSWIGRRIVITWVGARDSSNHAVIITSGGCVFSSCKTLAPVDHHDRICVYKEVNLFSPSFQSSFFCIPSLPGYTQSFKKSLVLFSPNPSLFTTFPKMRFTALSSLLLLSSTALGARFTEKRRASRAARSSFSSQPKLAVETPSGLNASNVEYSSNWAGAVYVCFDERPPYSLFFFFFLH